jgi:hypothetical protein
MTTTQKKKTAPADPLVAAATILIEGKAFEEGEKITGVSKDELDRAVSQRRVIRKSMFDARGVPAPEFASDEPEADADGEGENGGAEA